VTQVACNLGLQEACSGAWLVRDRTEKPLPATVTSGDWRLGCGKVWMSGSPSRCGSANVNPVAAGIAATPEKSPHTSFKARIDHCAAQGKLETLQGDSRYASKTNVEKGLWLFPIEDRRDPNGNGLAGMLHGISLSGYMQLVDWSSRLIRPGKQNLSTHVPDILNRLQIDAGSWKSTLEKLIGAKKFVGTYFGNTARLEEAAAHRGIKFLKNVTGRETPLTSPHAG
jgi:hypothetical protein